MSTPAAIIAARIRDAFALHNQGQLDAAAAAYGAILEQAPRNFAAAQLLGVVHLERGAFELADQALAKALKIEPKDAATLSNRGLALRALGRLDEALMCFNKSAAFNPSAAETHYNRGITLHDLHRNDEALPALDKAIALKPDYAEAHSDRGDTLAYLARFDEALAAFDRALALRPADARTLHNAGHALKALGRYGEACTLFGRAIAAQPGLAAPHIGISECLLVQGDFTNGWAAYERWVATAAESNRRTFAVPRWHGDTDITGKTILLHAEQGFGDTIQFCRYVPQVTARGAHVILEVQPSLARLMATVPYDATIVARGNALPPFDVQIPLMNL